VVTIQKEFYDSDEWESVRSRVYARDDYECFKCGEVDEYLNAHHVIPLKFCQGTDLETDSWNLVTLCHRCHKWVHEQGAFYNPFRPDDVRAKFLRFAVAYFFVRYHFGFDIHGEGGKPDAVFPDRE